jgi:phosphodiester glycosidase
MLLAAILCGLAAGAVAEAAADWKLIAPGMDLRWLVAGTPSPVGDSKIAVLRIDPTTWELELVGRSQTGDPSGRTAREWAKDRDLAVVINAGMFATDYKTHVGYMEYQGHVNSSRLNGYQSVAAFDPRNPEKRPPFQIFDLDEPGITLQAIRQDYASLVQNLRLIKKPGTNRWSKQEKMWSEAALGEDKKGRILFVFSRSPFSMHALNEELLSGGIGLVALQHLEGGPEAQLYLKVGNTEFELSGSYETSLRQDDRNAIAWPIPNVLGVRRRMVAK